jgi:hypothetical protein
MGASRRRAASGRPRWALIATKRAQSTSKLVRFREQLIESPLKLTPYFVEHDVDRPFVL